MTKRNTTIRINGQHYDVLTGVSLAYETTPQPTKAVSSKSIDGVIGGKHSAPSPVIIKPATVAAVAKPKTAARPKPAAKRTPASHAKSHPVTSSKVLLRHAVKKPTTAPLKRRTKVQTHAHAVSPVAITSGVVVTPKLSLYSLNHQRVARANQTALSPRVARFAHQLAVTVEHDAQQAVMAIDKAIVIPQTSMPSGNYRPDVIPATPARRTSDIFEQALLRATSHEEVAPSITTKKGRRALTLLRRRMVSFSAGAVVLLALVGGFGYQQSDSNQFRVAASQAGFSATMPSYQPNGYKLADVKVRSGYLNVRYTDSQKSYAVTQKPSSLSNQALATNLANSQSYNAVKEGGRTVYVYGRNQAAWVNNGILYQVLGNGALSTEQFVAIAASM